MTTSANRRICIKRDNISEYVNVLSELNSEDIFKEIWLLEEHIKYLDQMGDIKEIEKFQIFLDLAKKERDDSFMKRGIN